MFKLTRGGSGLRRAGGGGVQQTSRVSGLSQIKQASTEVSRRRRPAFLPDTPEEQAWDASSPRLGGLEK